MTRAVVFALVLASSTLLDAQVPIVEKEIVRLSGGVEISTRDNVRVSADRAEFNQKTGEVFLFGNVVLRQNLRPATEPFPAPKEVMIRLRGNFHASVGDLTISAEEADVNVLNGEMALRGNVRLTSSQWTGQSLQWAK